VLFSRPLDKIFGDPWKDKTRQQIEQELLDNEAMALAHNIALGEADRALAVAQVARTHAVLTEAPAKYTLALNRFAQLVVHREMPEG
jgi:hypothetical protein